MSTLSGLEFEEAPAMAMMHPGFSLTVAFEALHSKLALEFWKKSSSDARTKPQLGSTDDNFTSTTDGYFVLSQEINCLQTEVQQWRVNMEEMLRVFEVRKQEEFERLRQVAESQVLVARQRAEQQVECLQMLHAVQVKEMYEICMHLHDQQKIKPFTDTEELLASLSTQASQQLRAVVATQQEHIKELQLGEVVYHLEEQRMEEEMTQLNLSLTQKEQVLESLKKEVEGLVPKLQGYMEAREHLLHMTVKEKTAVEFRKLEMSLKNEQRENAWLQRAVKENKRKRADRLSRLQQEVTDLKKSLASKGDTLKIYEARSCSRMLSNPKDSLDQHLSNLDAFDINQEGSLHNVYITNAT